MLRGSLAIAAAVCLLGTPAWAQVNRRAAVSPLHFNNPTNQAGMYNNSPVLQYNNPLNQAGLFNNSAVLRYNNPLNQAGLYGGANWNNPIYQGNYNYGGFNSPLYQGNYNAYGFNNATTQGNAFNGFGVGGQGNQGGVVGNARSNPNAAAFVGGNSGNGTHTGTNRSSAKSGTKRKSTSRRR